MQYARLRCNLSRAVGPVGIKGNLSVTVSIICNYVRSSHSRSGLYSQGGKWSRERIATIILVGWKRKRSVTQPWYLGVVQNCVTRNRCGGKNDEIKCKKVEGGRLIGKIDCEKRSVFFQLSTVRWQFWHSFMHELSSGDDSQVDYAPWMVWLEFLLSVSPKFPVVNYSLLITHLLRPVR